MDQADAHGLWLLLAWYEVELVDFVIKLLQLALVLPIPASSLCFAIASNHLTIVRILFDASSKIVLSFPVSPR
jgi:hypothetical protein